MSFWTAMVVIFAIGTFGWVRIQRDRSGSPLSGPSSREPEMEREIEQLRKRIAVLERIAIEERGGDRLAREIDALRD